MTAAFIAAGAAIAAADLGLAVISWRRRTVLGGLLSAAGILLIIGGFASNPTRDTIAWLVIAAVLLGLSSILYVLGHVMERLLGAEPDDRGPPGAAATRSGGKVSG